MTTNNAITDIFTRLDEIEGVQHRMTQQALQELQQILGKEKSFTHEGNKYQLRRRNSNGRDFLYLATMKKAPGRKPMSEEDRAQRQEEKEQMEARLAAPDVQLEEGEKLVEAEIITLSDDEEEPGDFPQEEDVYDDEISVAGAPQLDYVASCGE